MSVQLSRPKTAFDSPQATLRPDSKGPRLYGNVSNVLSVNLLAGRELHVAVAVPTMIFTYMRDVMKLPLDAQVSMYLDEDVGSRFYVFGLNSPQGFNDLWCIDTKESFPRFVLDPGYRL